MEETGDPTTLAPKICAEVMSDASDWAELEEEIDLCRAAGGTEVWVVEEGDVRFLGEERTGAVGPCAQLLRRPLSPSMTNHVTSQIVPHGCAAPRLAGSSAADDWAHPCGGGDTLR